VHAYVFINTLQNIPEIQSLDHSSKATVGDEVNMAVKICVDSRIRLSSGKTERKRTREDEDPNSFTNSEDEERSNGSSSDDDVPVNKRVEILRQNKKVLIIHS
jgi:hypothetical protein